MTVSATGTPFSIKIQPQSSLGERHSSGRRAAADEGAHH
jgi:hypothetical protein